MISSNNLISILLSVLLILSSLPLDWNIPDWADDVLIRKVIGEGIPPLLIKRAIEALTNEKINSYNPV